MKMKLVANVLIMMGLSCMVIAVFSGFLNVPMLFPAAKPISFVTVANTCLLLALVLKLANE